MVGRDGEVLSAVNVDDSLAENGRTQADFILPGADIVKAQGAQYVPGGHLSAVFVAAETVGLRSIQRAEDLPYSLLCLPRLASVIVEVGDMMARLVAVGVLPDEAGDVGLSTPSRLLWCGEQAVELGHIGLIATQCGYMAVHILWHEETVLPAVGFREMVVDLAGIERREPAPVGTRAHETRGWVEYIAPVGRISAVFSGLRRFAEHGGRLCDTPGIVGIFKRLGY